MSTWKKLEVFPFKNKCSCYGIRDTNIMEAFIGKLCTSVETMSFCMLEFKSRKWNDENRYKKTTFTMQFFPKQ